MIVKLGISSGEPFAMGGASDFEGFSGCADDFDFDVGGVEFWEFEFWEFEFWEFDFWEFDFDDGACSFVDAPAVSDVEDLAGSVAGAVDLSALPDADGSADLAGLVVGRDVCSDRRSPSVSAATEVSDSVCQSSSSALPHPVSAKASGTATQARHLRFMVTFPVERRLVPCSKESPVHGLIRG
jgi:hypothetical protein